MSQSDPSGSGWIQGQWNLLETALLAKDTVVAILRACAEEDVQGQAVLVLEGLGSGLIIDDERREDAVKALRTFKSRIIHQLRLCIGLSKGGISVHMSQSQNLIASFLLVCACKICFKDETTAAILHETMKRKGVFASVPVAPWQVTQVISSISGYSENLERLLPSHVFTQVLNNVKQRVVPPDTIESYIGVCKTATTGCILSDVFEALQNTEVSRITVEGNAGGIWLTAFFLWLCPATTDYFINGVPVLKNPEARLEIHLRLQPWRVQAWLSESEPSKVVFKEVNRHQAVRPELDLNDYYPIHSAKDIITRTSEMMKPNVVESIGQLAGALLDTAVAKGLLFEVPFDGQEGSDPRCVALNNICTEKFLNSYPNAMERFGWICDGEFTRMKTRIRTALEVSFSEEPKLSKNDDDGTRERNAIKTAIQSCYRAFYDTNAEFLLPVHEDILMDIADQSIHLAGEALLGSLCDTGLQYASFRPPQGPQFKGNAIIMMHMLFARPSSSSCGYKYFDLRAKAVEASVPRAPTKMLPGELAIVSNGYVAYSTVLESVNGKMTNARLASGIRVVPGSLRLIDGKDDPSTTNRNHFMRLFEEIPRNVAAARIFDPRPSLVHVFNNGDTYGAFELLQDPDSTWVEHLITPTYGSEKNLALTSRLFSAANQQTTTSLLILGSDDSPGRSIPIPVSWWESMQAIAFGQHVTGYNVLPEQIRKLVRDWRDRGYMGENRLVWHKPGHDTVIGQSPPRRYISMTAYNEQLRFFEAGYLCKKRRLYVRHAPPLEQCLKEAFEGIKEEPEWAIIA